MLKRRKTAIAYETGTVTSTDGTPVDYRRWGSGPAVVLLHGGMQAAQSFTALAGCLSDAFTVYVPNRRGRGRSGSFVPRYGLEREREDLQVLLRAAGARRVFGLSSGALIALYTALTTSEIDQLALYEPPLKLPDADPTAWVPQYALALRRGNLPAAMLAVIEGVGDRDWMRRLPRFVLAPLLRLAIASNARAVGPEDVPIRDLIPTMRYDAQLASEAESAWDVLDRLRCKVLLLGGDRSALSLRRVLGALAAKLPAAAHVELPGVGHTAPDNEGRPAVVARALRDFFSADAPSL